MADEKRQIPIHPADLPAYFVDNADGTWSLKVSAGTITAADTIADGADVTQGALADAAVLDAAGSVNGHVRGIVKALLAALPGSLGQKNMAGSTSVVLASDQSAVAAAQSGTWTVQPGNTANTTAWKVDGSAVTQPVSGTFWQATQPVSGTVTANAGTGTFKTQPTACTTGTTATVAGSASSVTLIASNAARLGATVVNESSAICYVKCAATASATSYTIALGPAGSVGSYWEVPYGYTGIITGIWASATGNARVTEFTA